ncbi:hypothetical protein [Sphingomonas olei]|uniref:Uncharacterized protein n=1 Tax=Sphingomonas olei TaxID=1886787 RepID=A0ABY2QHZ5_9SPHN|nr:hypothetical protein [Sphingomonas olei]THG40429.1 hypothetical protein E5988_06250 [Sphingomonas olei]
MSATSQRRPAQLSELDRLTPRWDDIVRRAALDTRSVRETHQLEEDAQAFADELIAAFRGRNARRPSCAPLCVSPDGLSAGW